MVCRFVQNEIFRTDERSCQGHPPPGSAGKRDEFGVRVQPQMMNDANHLAIALPAADPLPVVRSGMGGGQSLALFSQNFGHQGKDRTAPVFRHILGHVSDGGAGPNNDSGIRLPLPVQQGQQGGFSRAVATCKAKPFPHFHRQVRRVQQRLAAQVQSHPLHAQKCQNSLQYIDITVLHSRNEDAWPDSGPGLCSALFV